MSNAPLVHLSDLQKRLRVFAVWEKVRNDGKVHWAIECFAEMFGVFLYVYFGLGSTAGWVIGNIIKETNLSSILQIGLAYAFGIWFAIGLCSSSSGGHFNPCVTLSFVVFKGFPKLKACRYIIAQILGAYIASALVYSQWNVLIEECTLGLIKAKAYDTTMFTPNGPAGIFALYLVPGAQSVPRALLNEFVNSTLIGMIIWAALDPTNMMVPPAMGPLFISLAYAAVIWGFATPAVALNTARDLGARLFAMSIWGTKAAGSGYSAIACLINIPATLLGVFLYEVFFTDSDRGKLLPILNGKKLKHIFS
uniref:Aquaporin Lacbi1:387054 n=2 Tax=Laccaria bicolor (strain S238N-H82 / ATCC MYA-4686) TaxID=486041 RepID=AQP4_LACBS|nr:RecName: Full=Aquaporin Lacbi1:387054 [Laccaria bicolor S238N-H82]